MKDKKTYIILGISILFMAIGISFAFFSLNVIGNDTAKNNKIVTGDLELTFTDTSEISLNNMLPGDSVTKTIKVSNTGTKEVAYNIGWTDYTNEITNNELLIEGTCKRLNSSNTEEGTCNSISQKEITSSNFAKNIKIEPNITHEYTLKLTFIDTNENQNYNVNKSFNAKINVSESNAKYCIANQFSENEQYTYRYMKEGSNGIDDDGTNWRDITTEGWGVVLSNKTSTEPITTTPCTYIDNKPVVSMSYMFENSKASSIDLSKFNTSEVINMEGMFSNSQAATLNLSNFDTSNVTNMSEMFFGSQVTNLDLSNFDTSNVTTVNWMFSSSNAAKLDLSSFDTSNVTDMNSMFYSSQAATLDLSNFDTSKVTTIGNMFSNSTSLKTIYVSDKFITSSLSGLSNSNIFKNCTSLVGGSGTVYDSTKTDKTYARIDGGISNPGYFTLKN